MNILVLGGTRFVGRHIVEAARTQGHRLTLFHRGKTEPELFPELEHLHGDRDGGLDILRGRQWDAVIDTCGYVPRLVRDSVKLLANAAQHYTFISSISAYADFSLPRTDENAPLAATDTPDTEDVTGETYGPLKVLCEQAVTENFPDRTLLVRPGLIVGPHDPTDRFTYWPARVAQSGKILVPGTPDLLIQFIDARDLAQWTVRLVEAKTTGIYNAVGPAPPLTMAEFLRLCQTAAGSIAEYVYAEADFLQARETDPHTINCWYIDPNDAKTRHLWNISSDKAMADGLTCRPTEATIQDTLAWDATRPPDLLRRIGIAPDRETELIAEVGSPLKS